MVGCVRRGVQSSELSVGCEVPFLNGEAILRNICYFGYVYTLLWLS